MRIRVDQERCSGHALCQHHGPDVYVLDDLGSRKEVEHIHAILERGTSADEQLRVYSETNDLKAVVDRLMELTMEHVPRDVDLSVGKFATAPSTIAK